MPTSAGGHAERTVLPHPGRRHRRQDARGAPGWADGPGQPHLGAAHVPRCGLGVLGDQRIHDRGQPDRPRRAVLRARVARPASQ